MHIIIKFIVFYFVYKIANIKVSIKFLFIQSIVIFFIYGIFWNSFHPQMHSLVSKISIFHGPSGIKLNKNNWLYKILWNYHTIHYLTLGENKVNNNIILLGMDHIMGTYRSKIDNSEFCKNYTGKNKRYLKICKENKTLEEIFKIHNANN